MRCNQKNKIIAIDGPAGSGKSTVARLVAKELGYLYIDTGAMYRAVALKVLREKIDVKNTDEVIKAAKQATINLENDHQGKLRISLGDTDITKAIRNLRVTRIVSDVAKIPRVRRIMLHLQRKVGMSNNAVLEGRDIGTVVFPDAYRKFYLDASFKERVTRRYKELIKMGQKVSFNDIARDLKNRDTIDSTRKVAPLKKAEDAIYIDTTKLTISEVVDRILKNING